MLPKANHKISTRRSLSVNNNRLGSLPTVLGRLKQLRELQLCGNALSDLPIELFTLTNLTRLRLSRNMIQYLPRCARLTRSPKPYTLYSALFLSASLLFRLVTRHASPPIP